MSGPCDLPPGTPARAPGGLVMTEAVAAVAAAGIEARHPGVAACALRDGTGWGIAVTWEGAWVFGAIAGVVAEVERRMPSPRLEGAGQ